jgi:hypothetical protein
VSKTVRLEISIKIDQHDGDYDTGYSVEQWNAMTDTERSAIYHAVWNVMAQQDGGGVTVLTEGAEDL